MKEQTYKVQLFYGTDLLDWECGGFESKKAAEQAANSVMLREVSRMIEESAIPYWAEDEEYDRYRIVVLPE